MTDYTIDSLIRQHDVWISDLTTEVIAHADSLDRAQWLRRIIARRRYVRTLKRLELYIIDRAILIAAAARVSDHRRLSAILDLNLAA